VAKLLASRSTPVRTVRPVSNWAIRWSTPTWRSWPAGPRANTLRAVAHDLKTFVGVVDKDPAEVVAAAEVFDFLAQQRGDRTVIRVSDGESGLSARTIARRLSSISGLYAYLVARGDTPVRSDPVPRGLSTRRRGGRRQHVPLVRVPRTSPKILSPVEVNALVGALRTDRDRPP
jgi:integrase/recombinase XerD